MNTRRIIISSFMQLLSRHNVGEITVNMIISAAEVSKPTFYRYFYSKYELVNVVFEEILEPFRSAAEGIKWRDVLDGTLASLERNASIMKCGFRSAEEVSLRDICIRQILEKSVRERLQARGLDMRDQNVFFATRALVLVHVAAFVGWVCDTGHQSRSIVVEQLCDSLPALLIREIMQ